MIEAAALAKLYGDVVAVEDLSFRVQPGEVLGLVGPNGAGKTSTLRCLCGIIPPTRGAVRLGGHDLATDPVAAKRLLAWFPDEPRLFEHLTAREHLAFVGRIYGVPDFAARGRALLGEFGLADKQDALPAELSRGMKQKLAIACGFLHDPRVIVLDEPLTGLDPFAIRQMKDALRRRVREGAAVILSSHLLHLVEEISTHVLILHRGRTVLYGTLEQARNHLAAEGATTLEEVFLRVAGDGAGGGGADQR
jgi:ABC-2 type transport system ATP-binding protein